MTNQRAHFPMPKDAFLVAVSDEWGVTLETPTEAYDSPAAALEANDGFEHADRVFLCLPAEDRMVDVTEELAEAWLAANRDLSFEELRLVDAVNGVHGKVMRWLVETRAYEAELEAAEEEEAEREAYGSYEEQHRLTAAQLGVGRYR